MTPYRYMLADEANKNSYLAAGWELSPRMNAAGRGHVWLRSRSLPGPGHNPHVTCPKCGKAVMLFAARAHMIGHSFEDAPPDAWEGADAPMTDLRSTPTKAIDETVERLCKVMLRYAEDRRGPSTRWCQEIANVIETLMRARRLA